MSRLRVVSVVLLLVVSGGLSGCSMLPHAFQPSQLRKLNRGPALGRDTTNFSIPDPQPPQDFGRLSLGEDPFETGQARRPH